MKIVVHFVGHLLNYQETQKIGVAHNGGQELCSYRIGGRVGWQVHLFASDAGQSGA